MNIETVRASALCQLLATPDPPDLPQRAHRSTQDGKADRFRQLPWLASVYVQSWLQEREDSGRVS